MTALTIEQASDRIAVTVAPPRIRKTILVCLAFSAAFGTMAFGLLAKDLVLHGLPSFWTVLVFAVAALPALGLLWQLFGWQDIVADPQTLTLRWRGLGIHYARRYPMPEIAQLRAITNETFALAFDHHGAPVMFGQGLGPLDAARIADAIGARFPTLLKDPTA